MNRRGFLGVILTTGCAPAIVRVESLMKIVVPSQEILTYAEFPIRILNHGIIRDFTYIEETAEFTLAQIVSETFRKHKDEIKANIIANNALLRRLQK